MDPDLPLPKPRVVRFKPKAPPRGKRKPTTAKPKEEQVDEANAQQLLQAFNKSEELRRQRPKVEDSANIKPTFTNGAKQPASVTAFSVPRGGWPNDDSDSDQEYTEPWDYNGSQYPMTLPLRMPHSGNPDILDKAEFGEAARKSEYDENAINAASELGFLLDLNKASESGKMILFQLPPALPLMKRAASVKGKEKEGSTSSADNSQRNGCLGLGDLPAGHMGKLVVYENGALKLKLGDTLYDVSAGSGSSFAQEVVAINAKEKKCCSVGDLSKKAIVTPDIDSILNSFCDN